MRVDILKYTKKEIVKAFGGCTKCFGKGYGTQTLFTETGIGDEWHPKSVRNKRWRLDDMVFCSCSRGKQLEKLLVYKANKK